MKFWITAWMALAAFAMADDLPPVEKAIPEIISALGPPRALDFNGGLKMAVTAKTEKAQAEVLQGLNHLHGGWEFEAARHFAVAMKEDPDCLLAHWGMVMCFLSPSPETDAAELAASERLTALIDAGQGSELERGYAYGLVSYLKEGPAAAANAFHKVSDKFPNDMQAAVFAALFGRSGYDEMGSPLPDQEKAENDLEALAKKFPESPVPLHALLLIRAEGLNLKPSLEAARALTQMAPNYAPYYHLLGHYEWRCGEHAKAASAFGRASTLFERWQTENKATLADCPDWVKSECYRIVALASKGDFETAYAAARRVAEIPVPEKRINSAGGRILLWEAKTLPARLLMKRGLPGNTDEALHSLPTPDSLKPTRQKTIASWWIDALRLYLDGKRLAEAGKVQDAMNTAAVLAKHGETMSKFQAAATREGERSALNRAFHSVEILASELNGRVALASAKEAHGSALNWYLAAKSHQNPATMLYPPSILAPMASRAGDYYSSIKEPVKAIDAYIEGLQQFPNDIDTLKSLKLAYTAAGNTKDADGTGALIEKLEQQ